MSWPRSIKSGWHSRRIRDGHSRPPETPSRSVRPTGASDPSGAPVADGDLAVLDDDGHPAPAARVNEHLIQEGAGLLDVAVLDRISLAGIGLPGLARVGSAVLAVDDDGLIAHIFNYRERFPAAEGGA